MFYDLWRIISEQGGDAVNFSSMLEFSVNAGGSALTTPIEEGSFATYNKIQSPLDISLQLAVDGDAYAQQAAVDRLEEMRNGLEKVALSTPYEYYDSLTIDSFSHRRAQGLANHALVADLHLVEVREVGAAQNNKWSGKWGISLPKNPISASLVELGLSRARDLAGDVALNVARSRLPPELSSLLEEYDDYGEYADLDHLLTAPEIKSYIKIF